MNYMKVCWFLMVFLYSGILSSQEQTVDETSLSTTVQGNREQPKVLYILPWGAPSGPGELGPFGRHSGNVFERAFSPVERIELQRQLDYYAEEDLPRVIK